MKAQILIFLVAVTAALSARIKPNIFPVHPINAPKHHVPKIVGGQEVASHSIPYQVGLFMSGSFCGGSLISTNWVLTAAHCGELSQHPEVVLGAHRIQQSESSQVILTGSRVIVHRDWDSQNLVNDIALIQLPQAVTLNNYIKTIETAPANAGSYAGSTATASGWGLAYDGATSISAVLRAVQSGILTNSECQNEFGAGIPVESTIICLDGRQGKSTCSGDSGGPLTVNGVQVGLTSFGVSIGCEKGYPAAFTRLSSYHTWINQNIS